MCDEKGTNEEEKKKEEDAGSWGACRKRVERLGGIQYLRQKGDKNVGRIVINY